eukprot:COSAG04_NODE_3984_length_2381_cov_1.368536_3_plen_175_part_00
MRELKGMVEQKKGIAAGMQRLVFDGEQRGDAATLRSIGARDGATLNVVLQEEAPAQLVEQYAQQAAGTAIGVTAQTIMGEKIPLQTRADATIGALKLMIWGKKGTQVGLQRLVFGDQPQEDTATLREIGIGDGATIMLVMREGMPPKQEPEPEPEPGMKLERELFPEPEPEQRP